MAHCTTVFNQIVKHLPRSKFAKFVREHNGDRRVRTFSCWKLFLSHIFAQLSGVDSLRDLETTFRSRRRGLYHLGLDEFSRSTMADANEKGRRYFLSWLMRRTGVLDCGFHVSRYLRCHRDVSALIFCGISRMSPSSC